VRVVFQFEDNEGKALRTSALRRIVSNVMSSMPICAWFDPAVALPSSIEIVRPKGEQVVCFRSPEEMEGLISSVNFESARVFFSDIAEVSSLVSTFVAEHESALRFSSVGRNDYLVPSSFRNRWQLVVDQDIRNVTLFGEITQVDMVLTGRLGGS
jgi:hypothetical protein